MSEDVFLKCPCKECGNNIQFPASAKGTTVECPHCRQWTELVPSESKPEGTAIKIGLLPLIACVVVVALAAVGGGIWFFTQHKQAAADNTTSTSPANTTKVSVPKLTALPATNSTQASATTSTPEAPKKPSRPKSLDDLKVGAIQLEKTKGSSLVYAVGTLKNDSEYERYGVRLNLDLFNSKGAKIGTATDYKESLTPHQEWQFHAMVLEPKTAKVELGTIKED